jgi:hypothetical protein
MWLMLQQPYGDDYVCATGESHTVRELCELAFGHVGLDYREFVDIDPRYYRPTEVDFLLGDASKAEAQLGWKPRTSFEQLVTLMMESDLELAMREKLLPRISSPGAGDGHWTTYRPAQPTEASTAHDPEVGRGDPQATLFPGASDAAH